MPITWYEPSGNIKPRNARGEGEEREKIPKGRGKSMRLGKLYFTTHKRTQKKRTEENRRSKAKMGHNCKDFPKGKNPEERKDAKKGLKQNTSKGEDCTPTVRGQEGD